MHTAGSQPVAVEYTVQLFWHWHSGTAPVGLTISSSLPESGQLSITHWPGGIGAVSPGQSAPAARFGLHVGIPLELPGQ